MRGATMDTTTRQPRTRATIKAELAEEQDNARRLPERVDGELNPWHAAKHRRINQLLTELEATAEDTP